MLHRIRAAATAFGWKLAFLYGANRLCDRVGWRRPFYVYDFVAQPVPARPMLSSRRGASLSVVRIEQGDRRLDEMPLSAEVLAYRYGQGAVCLAAIANDRIIGYMWLLFGPYDEDEVRARYVPTPTQSTAFDFDIYVDPEARGGPAFVKLWDAANALLRDRGVGWSMSRVSRFNLASVAAHARLGARPIGAAVFSRIGAFQLCVARAPMRFHISVSDSARPAFTLRAPDLPMSE